MHLVQRVKVAIKRCRQEESNTGFRLTVVVKNQRISSECVADIVWRGIQLKQILADQRRPLRHRIQDAQLSPTFTSRRDKRDSGADGFLVQPPPSGSPSLCDIADGEDKD
jgi:hypothetical protein